MIIAIDFDGVIADGSKYPAIGKMLPGAATMIKRLHDAGNYIIINTCRTGKPMESAIRFLLDNGITYDAINEQNPEMTKAYGDTRKIFADVYIDDHNLGGFPGWESKEVHKLLKPGANTSESSKALLKNLIRDAAAITGVAESRILGTTTKREVAHVRFMICFYAREHLNIGYDVIAYKLGYADHVGAMYGHNQCKILMDRDKGFRSKFQMFLNRIEA